MKPSEDEIIAHIKDSLSTYEEAYVPGSWEKFDKQASRKPGMVLWIGRISSAAAVILIGTAVIWYIGRNPVARPEHTAKAALADTATYPSEKLQPAPELAAVSPLTKTQVIRTDVVTDQAPVFAVKQQSVSITTIPEPNNTAVSSTSTEALIASTGVIQPNKAEETIKPSSIEAFLKDETDKLSQTAENVKEAVRRDSKWEVGVVVSPSFGNTKKINMGYGLSMGYSLSNKISVNSGISYSEMAASKSVGQTAAAASAIAGDNKSLESIEQQVTGIDIPLDIKYNISKNIYANVGVSAFAVLQQRQNNNYVQERLVDRSFASPSDSKEYNALIVNEKVTEHAPPSEIDKNNYIGFYNFSFGYKQKVSKDKSISIEPFMKVPMKEVTRDNLRLMGTGVKLRFDF